MAIQHPVPDEYLKHIGDITVSFALLEFCLKSLTQSLLGIDQRMGQIVTAELSFQALRALTSSLYLERNGKDEDFKKLHKLIKSAAIIEGKRNQITHSIWGAADDKSHIMRIKTTAKEKNGLEFHAEKFTIEQLAKFSFDIKTLASAIQNFWLSLIYAGKATNSKIVA